MERSQRPGVYPAGHLADTPGPTARVFESRIEFQSNAGTIRRTFSPRSRRAVEEERARAGQEFTIDLKLYTEVLWRHRLLVGVGLAVALALAFLSHVRVSSDGLADRKQETWSNASVLVLSQESFPEGRSVLPPNTDPSRFAAIADQYAALATSDAVVASLKKQGLLKPDGGNSGAPDRSDRGAVHRDRRSDASARADGGCRNAGRSDEAGDPGDGHVHQFRKDASAGRGDPESSAGSAQDPDQGQCAGTHRTAEKDDPIFILLAGLTFVVAAAFIRDNMQRNDDLKRKRVGPPYQLEAAPVLDPLETPEADAPDPVFRGTRPGPPMLTPLHP